MLKLHQNPLKHRISIIMKLLRFRHRVPVSLSSFCLHAVPCRYSTVYATLKCHLEQVIAALQFRCVSVKKPFYYRSEIVTVSSYLHWVSVGMSFEIILSKVLHSMWLRWAIIMLFLGCHFFPFFLS